MARIEPEHFWLAGIEIRPNIFTEVGDRIDYHAHAFPHLTQVWAGRFRELKTGKEYASVALNRGGELERRLVIEAGTEHAFEVLELENGVAVLECLWPAGVK